MERNERYEVNSHGEIVVGEPQTLTPTERDTLIEEMFSINGWEYTLVNRVSGNHYEIKLTNNNLDIEKNIQLFHGNIRKEDPDRNRAEKKIQLGGTDPREYFENGIILGFYVFEDKTTLSNAIIVSWPIEEGKNYPGNPSLRVNANTEIQPAKNVGYYIDKTSGKNLIVFRPEFIYHFLENYKSIHYSANVVGEAEQVGEGALTFETGYRSSSNFPHNRILFGAPGTGKSFKLKNDIEKLLETGGEYERVTFHPDYTYANFVGTYKPVPYVNEENKNEITYDFVPGPFMRVYAKALLSSKTDNPKPQLLIIEEINRANVAAVFGEVFQLLDRDEKFISEYPIQPSEDIKKYLVKTVGIEFEDIDEIRIPDNMFIWATMNNADQGVLPLDTAFKRRWDFEYLNTDNEENQIANKFVVLGKGSSARRIVWNELRKAINDRLSALKVNEDKLLGTFFISKHIVVPEEGDEIDSETFTKVFKNKVLMYLFEDAAKQIGSSLFKGCKNTTRYSYICDEFDKRGIEIFGNEISDLFPKEDEIETDSSEESE
ncbi:AAA family ATPase [Bacillus sp. FJAT-47783]|uniref:AAA family ATPase n=1 Tax=Bacillus sp. FJAT-47783 TaxID=2922712 RepID=UPI001FAD5EAA|nr:AAA family ATPase [Bacillus sp. FJAT-47783]